MDWLKLFTLLVAVASITVKADEPKKKIRIHLPQKVKHIHHHKKIYITNHPAPSQYVPAYMPNAEGSGGVSSNVALPAMGNIIPLNSVDFFEEQQPSLPHISQSASQILPLYHARGYYGPTPSEIEEQDYDTIPLESDYPPPSHSSQPKKVKIIRLNEQPRKKIIRKPKPKRVIVRNKPHPTPSPDVEHPVSTFHEHFYSDVDGSGTIRKIKKPPRVEKIVDGDTEHIHTYSEEHIHKLFFDHGPKIAGVVGVDPLASMSSFSGGQAIIPLKSGAAFVALPTHQSAGLTAVGQIANNPQFEYASFNPREVTHDHIFHDHGEITSDIELNKEALGLPPKVSYNTQGLKIGGSQKRPKPKIPHKSKKINKPTDFSYYENIYASKPIKQRPLLSTQIFDESAEADLEDYRSSQDINLRENNKISRKPSFFRQTSNDYRGQQASVPAPFAVSPSVIHEYKRNSASVPAALTKIKDPFANFKDAYSNNFEYDTYASSSNQYTSEDKNDGGYAQEKRTNKKSLSDQNINFGGQEYISFVDHINNESTFDDIDDGPTALEDVEDIDKSKLSDNSKETFFSSNDVSSAQQYLPLTSKTSQADQTRRPEAAKDNYRYTDILVPSTTSYSQDFPSTLPSVQRSDPNKKTVSDISRYRDTSNSKISNRNREVYHHTNQHNSLLDNRENFKTKSVQNQDIFSQDPSIVKGKLKYGDKI
ncbi:uncharacterized protein LOC116777834 [Danaus plexippus]|uniref:uncharacterized protein LOC116777834 n=1 Tax=Danaus plexippus TaxID=13037 RepID=UPI002AB1D7BA|nr:uncharacterized protein LOC116777834 [Danaus plexippus]